MAWPCCLFLPVPFPVLVFLLLWKVPPKVAVSRFLRTGSSLARACTSATAAMLVLAASSAFVTLAFTILVSWSSHHL